MRMKRWLVVLVSAAILVGCSAGTQLILSAQAGAGRTVTPARPAPAASANVTPRAFLPVVVDQPTRIAVIGDFGLAGSAEAAVAGLVDAWSPNYIVTTGDNNYYDGQYGTIDQNIGQYYANYIYPYSGTYPATGNPGYNRFFPVLGNHDWNAGYGYAAYLDYFALPGNERYYDVQLGPAHFFMLNSDPYEPDGITATSAQAQWLQSRLSASTACWKVVVLHHAPYSSSAVHGSTTVAQWPYAAWGADMVMAGHAHVYERLQCDGIPYIVNGVGGAPLYAFGAPIFGSLVRYNAKHGAMHIDVRPHTLRISFVNVDGAVIDQFTLSGGCAP